MSLPIPSGWHDLQFVSLFDEILQGYPVEDKVLGTGLFLCKSTGGFGSHLGAALCHKDLFKHAGERAIRLVDDDYSRLCLMFILLVDAL